MFSTANATNPTYSNANANANATNPTYSNANANANVNATSPTYSNANANANATSPTLEEYDDFLCVGSDDGIVRVVQASIAIAGAGGAGDRDRDRDIDIDRGEDRGVDRDVDVYRDADVYRDIVDRSVKGLKLLRGSHMGRVTSLACTADGNIMLSGSLDCSVLVWDVAAV